MPKPAARSLPRLLPAAVVGVVVLLLQQSGFTAHAASTRDVGVQEWALSSNTVHHSVAAYAFGQTQCAERAFSDLSSGRVLGPLHRGKGTACPAHVGVESTEGDGSVHGHRASTRDSSEAFNALVRAAGALSVEMWLTPGPNMETESLNAFTPLVGLSSNITTASDQCMLTANLQIMQLGRAMVVFLRSGGGCESFTFDDVLPENAHAAYTHLALTVNSTAVVLYANGAVQGVRDGVDISAVGAANWDDSYTLQLFSNQYHALGREWEGEVYLLALFAHSLSHADVGAHMNEGIPGSVPETSDVFAIVQEDGEVGTHQHDPAWYLSPVPLADLASVTLDVYDADLDSTWLGHDPEAAPMQVFVHTLPPVGLLEVYDTHGTLLNNESTVGGGSSSSNNNNNAARAVPMEEGGDAGDDGVAEFKVYLRPRGNAFSTDDHNMSGAALQHAVLDLGDTSAVFANFSFFAVDGHTGEVSADSSVFVSVAAVNDPPIPEANNVTAFARTVTLIRLSGDAVEIGDAVETFFITSLPTRGELYRANATHVDQGEPLSQVDGIPTAWACGATIAYKHTGDVDVAMDPATGVLTTDAFKFKLGDAAGGVGTEATINITVVTSLVACTSACSWGSGSSNDADDELYTYTWDMSEVSVQRMDEDTNASIALYGADRSELQQNLRVVITALPSHGVLWDAVTGGALAVGDALSTPLISPYTTGADLVFSPDQDYFSFPLTRYNGSLIGVENPAFSFRVEAVPDSGEGTDLSTSVPSSLDSTVALRISNVNDATGLSLSSSEYDAADPPFVYAFGYLDDDDGGDSVGYRTVLDLPKITLWDVDADADVVVVSISAQHGILSVPETSLDVLDFTGGLYGACFRYADWQCKGDGTLDKTLLFVAQPSDAARALASLSYRCVTPNVDDEVLVKVFDGEGKAAGCMDGDDLDAGNAGTERNGECTASEVSMKVEVGQHGFIEAIEACDASASLCLSLGEFIAVAFFFLLCVVCGCCGVRLKHKHMREQEDGGGGGEAQGRAHDERFAKTDLLPASASRSNGRSKGERTKKRKERRHTKANARLDIAMRRTSRVGGQLHHQAPVRWPAMKDASRHGHVMTPGEDGRDFTVDLQAFLKALHLERFLGDLESLGVHTVEHFADVTAEDLATIDLTSVERKRLIRSLPKQYTYDYVHNRAGQRCTCGHDRDHSSPHAETCVYAMQFSSVNPYAHAHAQRAAEARDVRLQVEDSESESESDSVADEGAMISMLRCLLCPLCTLVRSAYGVARVCCCCCVLEYCCTVLRGRRAHFPAPPRGGSRKSGGDCEGADDGDMDDGYGEDTSASMLERIEESGARLLRLCGVPTRACKVLCFPCRCCCKILCFPCRWACKCFCFPVRCVLRCLGLGSSKANENTKNKEKETTTTTRRKRSAESTKSSGSAMKAPRTEAMQRTSGRDDVDMAASAAVDLGALGAEELPTNWQCIQAESGVPYYHNPVSRRVTWTEPKFRRSIVAYLRQHAQQGGGGGGGARGHEEEQQGSGGGGGGGR